MEGKLEPADGIKKERQLNLNKMVREATLNTSAQEMYTYHTPNCINKYSQEPQELDL